jgi:hypothetical protein
MASACKEWEDSRPVRPRPDNMTQKCDRADHQLNAGTGTSSPQSPYSIQVFRSDEEILTLRHLWEQWAVEPTSDIDQFLLVCRIRDNVRNPHVIVVSGAEGPVAILAARLENGKIASSLGYFASVQFSVRNLSVVYGGLLGRIDDKVAAALMKSLSGTLETREADVVTLYYLPPDSPLLAAAMRQVSYLWRDSNPSLNPHWQLMLQDKSEEHREKIRAKHRSLVSRKTQKLEQAFPGRVTYHNFESGDDVRALCGELESVARLTYQRGLGEGFMDDADHRERFELYQRRKTLRARIIRVDHAARAFDVGYLFRDVYYFSETGYDPKYRAYEMGTVTFLQMIDLLIEEGVTKFDFGLGDAHYKQRFGNHSWHEAMLRLYSPSAKGFLIRWCIGFADFFSALVRRLVKRFGFVDRLKKAWRQRLSEKMKNLSLVSFGICGFGCG